MPFSERAKTIALAIVHIFETAKPLGDYGSVAVLTDGAGFSVGINQFTHKSGSLALVLDRYAKLGGAMPDVIVEAMPDFRSGRNIATRQADRALKDAIKSLAPNGLWQQAQREIAFEKYLKPALDACEGSGFKCPLSLAVVYDSMNQGGYASVRNKVSASDSNEKAWIAEYCADRKAWLKSSKKSVVRSTIYRPNFFLGEIAHGNWDLNLPLTVNGHRLTDAILFPHNSAAVSSSNAGGGPTVNNGQKPPIAPTGTQPTENPPPTQIAENIINSGDTSNAPPPEDKTLPAPAKDGATASAAKTTILGLTVPPVIVAIGKGVHDLVEQGYIDAKDIGNTALDLLKANYKYVFLLIGLFILLLIVKKIVKQVTFWIQMLTHAIPSWNSITVVPQEPSAPQSKWWEIWK